MKRAMLEKITKLVINESWIKLCAEYPQLSKIAPSFVIKTNMRTDILGQALIEYNHIRLNEKFFKINFSLFLSDIIPHELAHVAAWQLFKCENHGIGWKKCCKILKIKIKTVYKVKYP